MDEKYLLTSETDTYKGVILEIKFKEEGAGGAKDMHVRHMILQMQEKVAFKDPGGNVAETDMLQFDYEPQLMFEEDSEVVVKGKVYKQHDKSHHFPVIVVEGEVKKTE